MDSTFTAVAAVATLASALFVWIQVREMQRQTALQREIREAAEQPYVYADVDVQQANGWMLELIIGNTGPTVATNVRTTIDPPLRAAGRAAEEKIDEVHERLAAGIASLPPGRRLYFRLGPGKDLVTGDGPFAHSVRIECDGPFGAVTTNEYIIDLSDLRNSLAKKAGTMHEISAAIGKLTEQLGESTRRLEPPDDD